MQTALHGRSAAPIPPVDEGLSVPVKIGTVTQQLRARDIRFIAACENYSEVTLGENERLLVRRTLQQWSAILAPAQFVRVHRGLIVNLDQIGRIERTEHQAARLHVTGDSSAPFEVKRRHWPALRAQLEAWRAFHKRRVRARTGKSVAVLPFANLTRDPGNEVFCDGISEELLNVLAQVPGLHVAARTSSFYFKHRDERVDEIARQLDVDYVVEGSVRRSGKRLRITAQLIAASDGFHVWSDNFDRELTDIFAVQDEIAALIAQNLRLKLRADARAAPPVHPEAHRLAIEGRHFWNLRTADGFARAENAFAAALALDPDFAAAHAGLADLSVVRAMYRLADGAPGAAADLARTHAEAGQALALDPTLAEPHAAIGFAHFHGGRFAEMEPHFRRAFAVNPNYATGFQFYAWTLAGQGRLDRALAEYAKAIALDPLSFINLDRHAAMLELAGKFAEALEVNERTAALRPDVFVGNVSQRASILLALGRTDDAVATARTVRRIGSEAPFRRTADADAIFVLRQAGLTAEAEDYAAAELARLPGENYLRAFVLAALGHYDEAIAAAVRAPSIMLPFLYWSALWAPARQLPAFDDLVTRLGRSADYIAVRARPARG